MTLILGRKRGMTQLFEEDGTVVPVTVVQAGPCVVAQVKHPERDGYHAVQLGFEDVRESRTAKPQQGHFRAAKTAPKRFLREERLAAAPTLGIGDLVRADVFAVGDVVDVIGTSKGRGFAGTIKRHNFNRGPKSHGSMNYRQPGSIGTKRTGKLFPGKRMAGHFGAERCTTKNLRVVRVDTERDLLFIQGSVPGPNGGLVQVQTAKTGTKPGKS
ncbi:MAG TPA: 50S ribosomal protein L3 [Planctomycetota bacterium]|nr:50S ribosomal protein L3 [Planctomycetota bacterium]